MTASTAQTVPGETTPPAARGSRLVRRRWRAIAVTAVLVLAGTLLASLLQRPSYVASVDVLVLSELNSPTATPSTPSMGTEKALATSALVIVPAAQRVGAPVADVVAGTTVTVPPQTDTLEISCALSDPVLAARCAQAIGDAYVEYKDRQPFRTAPEAGRVVTGPAVPTSPQTPDLPLNLAAGLVVGLVLGLGVALARDRLDGRLGEPGDVERRGLRVLGAVPPWRRTGRGDDAERRGLAAYATLAAKVRHAAAGPATPVIAVTSISEASPGIGPDLATALAAGGDRVVLVHADTRGASPGGPGETAGLFDVLSGARRPADVLRRTVFDGLTELRLGGVPVGARIPRRAWSHLLDTVAADADVVVVAAPPLLATEDGLAVMQGSGAVLAAVDDRHCRRADVETFVAESRQLGLAVLGAALITRDPSSVPSVPVPSVPGPRPPAERQTADPESADPESADPESADPESADPESADPEAGTADPGRGTDGGPVTAGAPTRFVSMVSSRVARPTPRPTPRARSSGSTPAARGSA